MPIARCSSWPASAARGRRTRRTRRRRRTTRRGGRRRKRDGEVGTCRLDPAPGNEKEEMEWEAVATKTREMMMMMRWQRSSIQETFYQLHRWAQEFETR